MSRFKLSTAKRDALPLFIGLCGPSGSGKTYSALRLAAGIQRVTGGKVAFIDTEACRALHYAETFSFEHMPFTPPFSPDDYWEAISECVESGAKTIVIDSMSHEHEGPGGVLEWHESEVQRLAAQWKAPSSAVQLPAWAEPKAARRKLLNNILQVNVNLVCCFRAKRKVSLPTAEQKSQGQRQPIDMGWMPVAGAEFAYEMTSLAVLTPGCKGVPDWDVKDPGTEMVVKRPAQFERILGDGAQLCEDMGEAMARWALGAPKKPKQEYSERATALRRQVAEAADTLTLAHVTDAVAAEVELAPHEVDALGKAIAKRQKELSGA